MQFPRFGPMQWARPNMCYVSKYVFMLCYVQTVPNFGPMQLVPDSGPMQGTRSQSVPDFGPMQSVPDFGLMQWARPSMCLYVLYGMW